MFGEKARDYDTYNSDDEHDECDECGEHREHCECSEHSEWEECNLTLDEFLEPYLGGLEQRSTAWHEFRLNSIGGSQIASLFGMNPYQDRAKVIDDFRRRQGGEKIPIMGAACWWGTMFEPVVTRFVELDLGTTVKGDDITIPAPFAGHHNSPDGFCVVRERETKNGHMQIVRASEDNASEGSGGGKGASSKCTSADAHSAERVSIALLEFKCPYRRKPKGEVPEHYLPQVWSGLALSPVADFALFIDAVFRKCPLSSFDGGRHYDFEYHRESCTWGRPAAIGLVFVYAPRLDRPIARTMAEDETRWQLERNMLGGSGMAEPATDLWKMYSGSAGGAPDYDDPDPIDFGDSSCFPKESFDKLLYHIDRKHVKRGLIDPLMLCAARVPRVSQYLNLAFKRARSATPKDHYLMGFIPWKLFEANYVPVEGRPDFLDILKPMVDAFHKEVGGRGENAGMAFSAEEQKEMVNEYFDTR